MGKCVSVFEDLSGKIENYKKHWLKKNRILFLNVIRYKYYGWIKDQCDNLSLSSTVLKFRKKSIKIGKTGSTISNTRSNRQINNRQRNSNNEKESGYEEYKFNLPYYYFCKLVRD